MRAKNALCGMGVERTSSSNSSPVSGATSGATIGAFRRGAVLLELGATGVFRLRSNRAIVDGLVSYWNAMSFSLTPLVRNAAIRRNWAFVNSFGLTEPPFLIDYAKISNPENAHFAGN